MNAIVKRKKKYSFVSHTTIKLEKNEMNSLIILKLCWSYFCAPNNHYVAMQKQKQSVFIADKRIRKKKNATEKNDLMSPPCFNVWGSDATMNFPLRFIIYHKHDLITLKSTTHWSFLLSLSLSVFFMPFLDYIWNQHNLTFLFEFFSCFFSLFLFVTLKLKKSREHVLHLGLWTKMELISGHTNHFDLYDTVSVDGLHLNVMNWWTKIDSKMKQRKTNTTNFMTNENVVDGDTTICNSIDVVSVGYSRPTDRL